LLEEQQAIDLGLITPSVSGESMARFNFQLLLPDIAQKSPSTLRLWGLVNSPEGMPKWRRELELSGIQPSDPGVLLPGSGGVYREPAGLSRPDGTAVSAGAQYRDREDRWGGATTGGGESQDVGGCAGDGGRRGVLREAQRRIRGGGWEEWEGALGC